MSLIVNLAKFIDTNTSLTMDIDLFVGADVLDAPAESVVIREIPGSTENFSTMESRAIQVAVKSLSYVEAETLAWTVYNLLKNKSGFNDVDLAGENIFYCEVIGSPVPMDRDERGSFIFTSNFLIKRAL